MAAFTLTPELVLSVLALLVSILAFWVGVGRLWAAIHPIWLEHKSRRILEEKFSRGPYDEATIERSTHYYIRPKCSNIDPAQEREPRRALVATSEDLFKVVDKFLDHDDLYRHLLVLADSGMGKTSFVLNYYVHNARRPKRRRHRLALVPLGIKSADELIANIPNKDETVIFLDALDEDVKAIDDHAARISTLMDACRSFKRVIITCRTQFFPTDEEIPVETGIARIGPRKAGEKGAYEFWKLYLSPFDDEQVEEYIKRRYPLWRYDARRKAHAAALKAPLLSVRPMLLAHIPDVIASSLELRYVYQLYEILIDAWLERESAWVDKAALREFSERLAVDIFVNREGRGMERISQSELPELAVSWGIELHQWQISGRSLLNRDAQGNFKFAHRSIMEYLFVKRLIEGDENCYKSLLTDHMKKFLIEMLRFDFVGSEALDLILNVDLYAQRTLDHAELKDPTTEPIDHSVVIRWLREEGHLKQTTLRDTFLVDQMIKGYQGAWTVLELSKDSDFIEELTKDFIKHLRREVLLTGLPTISEMKIEFRIYVRTTDMVYDDKKLPRALGDFFVDDSPYEIAIDPRQLSSALLLYYSATKASSRSVIGLQFVDFFVDGKAIAFRTIAISKLVHFDLSGAHLVASVVLLKLETLSYPLHMLRNNLTVGEYKEFLKLSELASIRLEPLPPEFQTFVLKFALPNGKSS